MSPPILFNISYLAAFLGGMLTMLPSCGPFILPAFFAITFREKEKITKMIFIFFAGLLTTFIPLGLGISALVQFFIKDTWLIQIISGVLLILFGLSTLFGIKFIFERKQSAPEKSDPISLFIFGMLFGIAAGSCTAPIFGAVLTLAAQAGIGWHSLTILLTFTLGMIIPLIILAMLYDRIPSHTKTCFFRLRLGRFPLTNVLGAAIFLFLGILFLSGQIHTFTSSDFFTDLSIRLSNKILAL
jgi:cytochrome c biogenesis protein CcdA